MLTTTQWTSSRVLEKTSPVSQATGCCCTLAVCCMWRLVSSLPEITNMSLRSAFFLCWIIGLCSSVIIKSNRRTQEDAYPVSLMYHSTKGWRKQIDKQDEGRIAAHTGNQSSNRMITETNSQTRIHISKQIDKTTELQPDKQTFRQADIQTFRQTGRQAER